MHQKIATFRINFQFQAITSNFLSTHAKVQAGRKLQAGWSMCGVVVATSMAAPGTSSPSSPTDRNRGQTAKFSPNSSSNFCQTTAAGVSSQNIESTK